MQRGTVPFGWSLLVSGNTPGTGWHTMGLFAAPTSRRRGRPSRPPSTGSAVRRRRRSSCHRSWYRSGDNYYADGANTLNPWTVWTLRAPDISTWDPTNNPIVCQAEFPGMYPETSNDQPNGTINAHD